MPKHGSNTLRKNCKNAAGHLRSDACSNLTILLDMQANGCTDNLWHSVVPLALQKHESPVSQEFWHALFELIALGPCLDCLCLQWTVILLRQTVRTQHWWFHRPGGPCWGYLSLSHLVLCWLFCCSCLLVVFLWFWFSVCRLKQRSQCYGFLLNDSGWYGPMIPYSRMAHVASYPSSLALLGPFFFISLGSYFLAPGWIPVGSPFLFPFWFPCPHFVSLLVFDASELVSHVTLSSFHFTHQCVLAACLILVAAGSKKEA